MTEIDQNIDSLAYLIEEVAQVPVKFQVLRKIQRSKSAIEMDSRNSLDEPKVVDTLLAVSRVATADLSHEEIDYYWRGANLGFTALERAPGSESTYGIVLDDTRFIVQDHLASQKGENLQFAHLRGYIAGMRIRGIEGALDAITCTALKLGLSPSEVERKVNPMQMFESANKETNGGLSKRRIENVKPTVNVNFEQQLQLARELVHTAEEAARLSAIIA